MRAVGQRLRWAGLKLTRSPLPGDVAIVELLRSEGIACCAIRTASGWALRLEDGLAVVPSAAARVIAAWSV
jgi:hypothetical protein